jgi:serine/threonine-protein kinase
MIVAGRYRLQRRFAVDVCGSLWHAHDDATHLACTVRIVDAGVADVHAARERFGRLVATANAVRCENVVGVRDHGEWNGIPFVVLEPLDGENLAARLRRELRLPPWKVVEIVSDVALALARAHDLGILHRELDPEKIYLTRVGASEVAKVIDFGSTGSGAEQRVYASPEHAAGGSLDFRSDLWSLGAIAFHCLSGRTPFASRSAPLLHELDSSLPAALDRWCENALSHDPELRFQSAGELADALAQAFAHRPPGETWAEPRDPAASAAPDPRFFAQAHVGAHAVDSYSEAPLSRRRAQFQFTGGARPLLVISGSAVLGLLLASLGFAFVRHASERDPAAEARLGPPLASTAIAPATAELESFKPAPCQLPTPPPSTTPPVVPKHTGAPPRAPTKRRYFRTTREPDYGI